MKHTEYMAWLFIAGIGGGLLLKGINIFVQSERLGSIAGIVMISPFIIVICFGLIGFIYTLLSKTPTEDDIDK